MLIWCLLVSLHEQRRIQYPIKSFLVDLIQQNYDDLTIVPCNKKMYTIFTSTDTLILFKEH